MGGRHLVFQTERENKAVIFRVRGSFTLGDKKWQGCELEGPVLYCVIWMGMNPFTVYVNIEADTGTGKTNDMAFHVSYCKLGLNDMDKNISHEVTI